MVDIRSNVICMWKLRRARYLCSASHSRTLAENLWSKQKICEALIEEAENMFQRCIVVCLLHQLSTNKLQNYILTSLTVMAALLSSTSPALDPSFLIV